MEQDVLHVNQRNVLLVIHQQESVLHVKVDIISHLEVVSHVQQTNIVQIAMEQMGPVIHHVTLDTILMEQLARLVQQRQIAQHALRQRTNV